MKKYLLIIILVLSFPALVIAQEKWNFVKKQGSMQSTDVYYTSDLKRIGDKIYFKRLIIQMPYSQEELDKRFGVSLGVQYWTILGQRVSEKKLVEVHKNPIDYQMHYIEGIINCSQKNYRPLIYKKLNQQYKVVNENTFPANKVNNIHSTDSIEGYIYNTYCTQAEKKKAELFVIQKREARKNKSR